MQTITLAIDGMSCGHCIASVRSALAAVPGLELQDVRVGSAVTLAAGDARVAADAALAAVRDAGYDATADVGASAEATAGTPAGGASLAHSVPANAPATPVMLRRA